METLNLQTLKELDEIRKGGFNLEYTYECTLKRNKNFKEFAKRYKENIVEPLNPRDAFFGGRTNCSKLLYTFKIEEQGRYYDYVSLYPTVQYYKSYPIGHPIKIQNPETYDPSW